MDRVSALVAELELLPAYFAETQRLTGDVAELQEAQAKSMVAKIKRSGSISMADAIRLKTSIGKVARTAERYRTGPHTTSTEAITIARCADVVVGLS